MARLPKCPLCGAECTYIPKIHNNAFSESMAVCLRCDYHADIKTHRAISAKLKAADDKASMYLAHAAESQRAACKIEAEVKRLKAREISLLHALADKPKVLARGRASYNQRLQCACFKERVFCPRFEECQPCLLIAPKGKGEKT